MKYKKQKFEGYRVPGMNDMGVIWRGTVSELETVARRSRDGLTLVETVDGEFLSGGIVSLVLSGEEFKVIADVWRSP